MYHGTTACEDLPVQPRPRLVRRPFLARRRAAPRSALAGAGRFPPSAVTRGAAAL